MIARRRRRLICVATMTEKGYGANTNTSRSQGPQIKALRPPFRPDYAFYEEPCEFDHLEDAKAVADALRIPVAGGEQEFSESRFRWTVANRGLDIVQPDLHYYGGFIRSMRVARMAHAAGILYTPHMSGSGLGYLDAAHFASKCILKPRPVHSSSRAIRISPSAVRPRR